MMIHCCGCNTKVEARLTDGKEIYPHRKDLSKLPFWKCDTCKNYVGCHHKSGNHTQPLGCIPTKEIKALRQRIHAILDPLWKSRRFQRRALYELISDRMGDNRRYHTAQIRSVDEAQKALGIIEAIAKEAS